MNDSERTQDRAMTTEQIAAAGTAGSEDGTSPGEHLRGDAQAEQPASTMEATGSGLGVGEQPRSAISLP